MNQFFVNYEDNHVRVNEWGNTDKPTIICIHGLGSTSLSFIELGEILKDKYHIFSIDLPGHGKTPAFLSDEDYEMYNIISWLKKVIDEIEEKKFFLLAHSWGGDIALHYLARYPQDIKKLVLLDGGYYIKQEVYNYFSNLVKDKDLGNNPICSLLDEIEYYEKDFDEYNFSDLQKHIELEKRNYRRWTPLLEEAARDLMKYQDGRFIFHATGNTARGAIKGMYNSPTSHIYDKLPNNILLLQCTLAPNKYLGTYFN